MPLSRYYRVLNAALMGLAVILMSQSPALAQPFRAALPDEAPDLQATTLAGQSLSLGQLRGQVVLVNFFGSWCPPCRKEVPELIDLHKKLGPQGLVIVGLALERDATLAALKKYVADMGITYHVVAAGQAEVNAFGGVRGVPTTIIIDRQGKIAKRFVGYVEQSVIKQAVGQLLKG